MMLVTANIFQPLIDVFESVLKGIHSGGFSWGLSIVLLTLAVRGVLVPLTFRQIKGMVRMQTLQPQMKEIQQKYKEDKQRQQQEIMKFYRENNVNPLASCLPMVLQIPVFIALYYMLRESLRRDICPAVQRAYQSHYAAVHHLSSIAKAAGQTTACGSGHGHAHGASFLFISDLTAKGTGVELVILILLYVGSQLGSTLVMSASSTMDPTQRKIMLFMPLIFVLFVIRFPAGLMLYWITTNLWTVVQQYVVRRYIGPTTAVGGAGDDGAGSAVLSPGAGGPSAGGGSGGIGGFGGRMRERLERAQAESASKSRRGGGGKAAVETAAPAKSTAKSTTTKRSAQAKSGGSGANGSGGSGSAPPPRPPRKKKKRSGRRR
jgi:YidC/Oxa1 family membrane protein insertase